MTGSVVTGGAATVVVEAEWPDGVSMGADASGGSVAGGGVTGAVVVCVAPLLDDVPVEPDAGCVVVTGGVATG